MSPPVQPAFDLATVVVPLDRLLPTRQLTDAIRASPRYRTIAASIAEVGIIEPPVVFPQPAAATYLLLDGHVRVAILKTRGVTEVSCLVATDDEGYTYNHKVNRLAPIQEYRMVMKALEAGVDEARIARALNLSVEAVRRRRTMLHGVCAEVIALLKDKPVSPVALRLFRRVLETRQIEMAELMVAAGNYTQAYAHALVTRTPPAELTEAARAKGAARDPATDLARVEREVVNLERDMLQLQDTYGANFMTLTLARGYIRRLVDNPRTLAWLAHEQPDILATFHKLARTSSLDP